MHRSNRALLIPELCWCFEPSGHHLHTYIPLSICHACKCTDNKCILIKVVVAFHINFMLCLLFHCSENRVHCLRRTFSLLLIIMSVTNYVLTLISTVQLFGFSGNSRRE